MSKRLIPARAGNMRLVSSANGVWAAHPRSRGEHHYPRTNNLTNNGSSPLARGTYKRRVGAMWLQRLIPARAGNISGMKPAEASLPAHPRSRGEHPRALATASAVGGSSPLARGTFPGLRDVARLERLIPARAGNMCQ